MKNPRKLVELSPVIREWESGVSRRGHGQTRSMGQLSEDTPSMGVHSLLSCMIGEMWNIFEDINMVFLIILHIGINLKFLTNILIVNETKCSFKVECDYWWTHVWEKRTRNLLCFLLIFIENIPAGHLLLNNLFRQRKLSIYCHICSTFNFHERPAKCLYTRFTLISTLLHDC